MQEVLGKLDRWLAEGKRVAVATVVRVAGSAPRPEGASLLVSSAEELEGSVSAGCVENDVALHALQVLETGEPRLLTYGIADDEAFEVGLACGGTITVFVEPFEKNEVEAARRRLMEDRRLGAVLTVVSGGSGKAAVAAGGELLAGSLPPAISEDVLRDAVALMAAERNRTVVHGGMEVFVEVVAPSPPLLIFGAGPFAEPLCALAARLGYRVTVIDPRPAFADSARFPDAERVVCRWPGDVLDDLEWERSFVVVLNHTARLEDPVIRRALAEPVAYLGVLGSRRTHADRLARLAAEGWSDDRLETMHAPIGLDIGAHTPGEVALAILAEMTSVRYRAAPRPAGSP